MSSNTVNSTVEDMRQKVENVIGEITEEEEEIDEPELSELNDIGKYGKGFEENIEKMAEEVKEKHQELEQARSDLKRLHDLLDIVEGHPNPKFGEDTFKEMRQKLSSAKSNLESAKQAEGEIEGLREEAEHILKEQLNELEELGEAESSAREITTDANSMLMNLNKEEDELMKKIEKLEQQDNHT